MPSEPLYNVGDRVLVVEAAVFDTRGMPGTIRGADWENYIFALNSGSWMYHVQFDDGIEGPTDYDEHEEPIYEILDNFWFLEHELQLMERVATGFGRFIARTEG